MRKLCRTLPEAARTLMVDVSKVDDFGRAAVRIFNQVVRVLLMLFASLLIAVACSMNILASYQDHATASTGFGSAPVTIR